ncbi:pyruvate, water dikinase [Desulfosarcina sp. BuS5]|uniref:PEP/pyruvate-binding domain-containing protein n=1 Tax=Desulfosarcina sp. BuS5 TaxID=933262 RepID=UPI00054D88DA|nr:PEP/pyruvate-binding domain-containing protein [Desulfosarcina sp. BuS5]WDN87630.1 pyruvate, water dikinase [Desulfosarcina sp. BuS5]
MNFNPESIVNYEMDYNFRFRYETLRALLNKNGGAIQILSDLEADLSHIRHYDIRIKRPVRRLLTETLLMAQELNLLTGNRYFDLYETIFRLRNETDKLFKEKGVSSGIQPLALRIGSRERHDPNLVGGKADNVWFLRQYLGDSVPGGFVVTTLAYNMILEKNNLQERIRILLSNLDVTADTDQFKLRTQTIRRWIIAAQVPEEIEKAIKKFADLIKEPFHDGLWAVRSSAVCEDGVHSFAGQFDSKLRVKTEKLVKAYLHVLAGRFTDRAVRYRLHSGLHEIDTPMAVLFMPMVDPVAAGVIYTSDIKDPDSNTMVINAVPGLADRMVKGEESADTFFISKAPHPKLLKTIPASGDAGADTSVNYITTGKLLELAGIAFQAAKKFDHDLDIEWALTKDGKLYLLQARRMNLFHPVKEAAAKLANGKNVLPIFEGGITIFPGRAEGPVKFLGPEFDISAVPEGAIVIVEKPGTEFASVLPKIAALLVMQGNPVGHLATLIREFAVPAIFRLGPNAKILFRKNIISVNATKRKIYSGVRWSGIRERVMARIAAENRHEKSGPLYDFVLRLNLVDPDASSFKAKSCKSVHDTLRFMHEMSVRSMFGFGDMQKRGREKKSRKLKTSLPIKFQLIDLDKSAPVNTKTVEPKDVASVPFKALWRGISDKKIFWPEHWKKSLPGIPSEFKESVLGGNKGPRRASDTNYVIIAKDYMNLNARFAYHYAMVDAMVGPGTENNYVHFRFRGGGASDENRVKRAHFLELVLRQSGFRVNRQGDLVTAWLRSYPRQDSENALEILGRLMICASQLDAVFKKDSDVKLYVNYFLKGEYGIFA